MAAWQQGVSGLQAGVGQKRTINRTPTKLMIPTFLLFFIGLNVGRAVLVLAKYRYRGKP